jgi:RNA polymerase sigma-70 factor (ECF subfamily)
MPDTAATFNERAWISQAQQGNAQAFARLYDQHVDAIYRYIALRVPSQQHAEDLTEEVFWRAWKALARYRPERPFLHWLYRIAHNLVINDAKRAAKHRSYEVMAETGQTLQDDGPSPDDNMFRQEDIQQLRQALTTLSADEQTLLTMRFFDNASYDAIAPILGKSPGALRVLQHRALKKLAVQLAPLREAAA